MNRPYLVFVSGILVAAALVVCGWLIRDGLLALSVQVRDKPVAVFPEQVRLNLGDPDLKMSLGRVTIGEARSPGDNSGTIEFDNVKIEIPAKR